VRLVPAPDKVPRCSKVTLLSQVHFGYDSPHPVGTALRDALGAQIDDLVPWHVILEAERKERMDALEGTQVVALTTQSSTILTSGID
jgi:hypothetical protein